MYTPSEKREIIINTLLYILKQLGGVVDFHSVFKILYFADEKHLARYGTAMNPDKYEVKHRRICNMVSGWFAKHPPFLLGRYGC